MFSRHIGCSHQEYLMDELQRLIVDALQLDTEQCIGSFLLVNSAWRDFILQKASPVHVFFANRQNKTSYVHLRIALYGCQESDCTCSKRCTDVDVRFEIDEDWEGVTANLFGLPVCFQDGLNEIEFELSGQDDEVPIQSIRSIVELAGKLGLNVYVHVGCFEMGIVLNAEFPGMFHDACGCDIAYCDEPEDYPESFICKHKDI